MEKMTALEAHSGLSAKLIEQSRHDLIWVSSLTHSAARGLPDNELVPLKERVDLVEEIRRLTTKPIIVDIDTGGQIEHLPFLIKWFKDAGAWAVVIEDKKYPKQNSLLEKNEHQLEDVDVFCQKIKIAKENAGETKVIARLESLIAQHSMAEALIRADAYVSAGADYILIHSKEKITCNEVMEFARKFKEVSSVPLVAIPSTYDLPEDHPFEIVIYANMMLRASMLAMKKVAEAENPKQVEMVSVQEIFDFLGH
jgi:phosphoenolpyruvate phosphomutase